MSQKLLIVSAPSGAGKTTLVKHLLQEIPSLAFSISCTTRQARTGEKHAKDYYFIDLETFKQKITKQEFVEWEEVYPDCFYGTLKQEINRIWQQNKTVIFDIDVQGGINLKKKFQQQAYSIFIQAPSILELENRLRKRNTESQEKLNIRIQKAAQEMSFAQEFDCILTNNNLLQAKEEIVILAKQFLNQ